MELIDKPTSEFIHEHRTDDVRKLAFAADKYPSVDMPLALDQIQGWQTARHKLPSWAETDGIVYPPHLNMEQCSSEATARYKAGLLQKMGACGLLVDLTGGFGVDFSFMSQCARHAVYVEQNPKLCTIAAHNFELLGLDNTEIVNATSYALPDGVADAVVYLDPARRDSHGNRVYNIADCQPNAVELAPKLLEKAQKVIIKLSPMFDWHEAVRELPCVSEVHIVSVDNECKELLVVLSRQKEDASIEVHCVNDGFDYKFRFTEGVADPLSVPVISEEMPRPDMTLFVPNASVMKAGCFGYVANSYCLSPIGKDSHLFVSNADIMPFPGRRFEIMAVSSMNKKELRRNLQGIDRANIAVRNFPMTVPALRKRLKIADGGDVYIFATTVADGSHVLIISKKIL